MKMSSSGIDPSGRQDDDANIDDGWVDTVPRVGQRSVLVYWGEERGSAALVVHEGEREKVASHKGAVTEMRHSMRLSQERNFACLALLFLDVSWWLLDALTVLAERFRMPSPDVLIVNDRLMDAQATLVAFEQVAPRARVLHLMNGSEALQYLFSAGIFAGRVPVMPQLVVLSLEMKGIGGLCILDLMRAHPLTREIPVVLVGLDQNPRIYRRNDQFDASAYLLMPWDFSRYCAVIEGCASRWLPWALRPAGLPHGGRFKTSTMLRPERAPKFDTPHQRIELTLPSLNLAT